MVNRRSGLPGYCPMYFIDTRSNITNESPLWTDTNRLYAVLTCVIHEFLIAEDMNAAPYMTDFTGKHPADAPLATEGVLCHQLSLSLFNMRVCIASAEHDWRSTGNGQYPSGGYWNHHSGSGASPINTDSRTNIWWLRSKAQHRCRWAAGIVLPATTRSL